MNSKEISTCWLIKCVARDLPKIQKEFRSLAGLDMYYGFGMSIEDLLAPLSAEALPLEMKAGYLSSLEPYVISIGNRLNSAMPVLPSMAVYVSAWYLYNCITELSFDTYGCTCLAAAIAASQGLQLDKACVNELRKYILMLIRYVFACGDLLINEPIGAALVVAYAVLDPDFSYRTLKEINSTCKCSIGAGIIDAERCSFATGTESVAKRLDSLGADQTAMLLRSSNLEVGSFALATRLFVNISSTLDAQRRQICLELLLGHGQVEAD